MLHCFAANDTPLIHWCYANEFPKGDDLINRSLAAFQHFSAVITCSQLLVTDFQGFEIDKNKSKAILIDPVLTHGKESGE